MVGILTLLFSPLLPSKESRWRTKVWIGKEVCFLAFDAELITGLDHGLAAHDIRDSGRFRKIPWFDFFLLDAAGFGWLYMVVLR
jgi:hypothetical protein